MLTTLWEKEAAAYSVLKQALISVQVRQCLHKSLPKKINDTSPILSHYMTHAHTHTRTHTHTHTATVTKVHYTFCCDNIGLVSLIFLGRELCRHCLILSPVLFGPALYYSIFKIYQFLIYFTHIMKCYPSLL